MELRKKRRYKLTSPTTYWWPSEGGTFGVGQGVVTNVSTCGAFVLAQVLPPLGASLQLEMLLRGPQSRGAGMRLHGEGRVLRVEREDSRTGFAVSMQFAPITSDDPPKEEAIHFDRTN